MVLVEAMQSGVPIVSTDIPGATELLESLVTPVPRGNVQALAEALLQALQSEDDENNRQQRIAIAQQFTPAYAADAWQKFLSDVI
jgi:glycosyltransferase involved in cell wall biosynthesis